MDLLIHTFLGGMQMFCGHNCNYNICNYVLHRGLQSPGNVFYHTEVSSYGQGWLGYTGTHVPMFVHKLGLIKPRQT